MSDHAGFMAAIIANPQDDLPRLIYADFLDERGQCDRAEFIRLQCRTHKIIASEPYTDEYNDAANRIYELWRVHGASFASALIRFDDLKRNAAT